MCAKAKLLIAIYNDETTNVNMDVNIDHYKKSVEMFREREKSLVKTLPFVFDLLNMRINEMCVID